jgi:bacterioferritin
VQEIIDCDLKMEQIAVPVLRDAIEYSEKVRDYGSRDVFNKILHNEEEHIDWLETQLDQISQMGIQNYVQLQSKPNGSQALDK